jgi:hypothetical protein
MKKIVFVDSGNYVPGPVIPDPFPATYGSVSRERLDEVVKEFRAHQAQLIRDFYGLPPTVVVKDDATPSTPQ